VCNGCLGVPHRSSNLSIRLRELQLVISKLHWQIQCGLNLYLLLFVMSVSFGSQAQNIDKNAQLEHKRIFLLGEIHDNPNAHKSRLDFVVQLIAERQNPVIAMEQFDRNNQPALDLALSSCTDVNCVLSAAATPGWEWSFYLPYIQLALEKKVTLVAANVSNADIRRVITKGFRAVYNDQAFTKYRLNQVPSSLLNAQSKSIREGHCNMLPTQAVGPMVEGQIARDIWMASVIEGVNAQTVILIAGNGHVRKDAGVFQWLSQASQNQTEVHGYTEKFDIDDANWFDHTHVVTKIDREDPCMAFQKHLISK